VKLVESPCKVLEVKSSVYCKQLLPIIVVIAECYRHLFFHYELQFTNKLMTVICHLLFHYSIGECSTVHLSVTLHSKFWSTVRI